MANLSRLADQLPMRGRTALLIGLALLSAAVFAKPAAAPHYRHVLLVSIDGLHASDLRWMIRALPGSEMAALARHGRVYTHALTPVPSDSFPGLLAMVTGGDPKVTGVYYDDSYDRSLSPAGSDCRTRGAHVPFDEAIDADSRVLDAVIDPNKLPRDPGNGCRPVYPHQYLKVNTIFEVVRNHGGTTAWSDKHPAYDLLQGPSGLGVEDAYNPEIEATAAMHSVSAAESYDSLKARAVINEIDGFDHSGKRKRAVPTLFGLDLQEVNAAQKMAVGGYVGAHGVPGPALTSALAHCDLIIRRFVDALDRQHLADSTLLIVTAKSGNTPIDRARLRHIDKRRLRAALTVDGKPLYAHITADDIALVWLKPGVDPKLALRRLHGARSALGIERILSGHGLSCWSTPATASRVPDIVIEPHPGVVYAGAGSSKIAEHGGASFEDRNVALMLTAPKLKSEVIGTAVHTTQIAPTILQALNIAPRKLQAVRIEDTRPLPLAP